MAGRVPFNRENGREILERHFAVVEQIDIDGWVTFPDAEAIRGYVRSMILVAGEANAERVPDDVGPVRAGTRVTVLCGATHASDRHNAEPDPSVRTRSMMRPADLIERKRNGEELPADGACRARPRLRA